MTNITHYPESKLKQRALAALSVLLFFVIVVVLLDFKIYPYSDDLAYIAPLTFDSSAQLFAWAFEQHVDHTIPLQKLLHYFVAKSAGYDFRVLVILNAFVALLTSLALLRAAELFRGNTRWGDALIPLLVLNPSLQYSLWAFQFQFLSSIFFASVFLYCSLSYLAGGRRSYAYGSLLALLLATLCGMNGLVFSVVVTGGCVLWYLVFGRKQHKLHTPYVLATLAVIAVQAYVLLQWAPSPASSAGFQVVETIKAFVLLQVSALSRYAFSSTILKASIMAVAVAYVLAAYTLNWRRHITHLPSVILVLALVATEMVLASIAVGRSTAQGGASGILVMHYGVLAMLVPMLVWISFQKSNSWWKETLVSVLIILFAAAVYKQGFSWRLNHEQAIYETQADVHARLNTEAKFETLVSDHISEFYWIHDEDSKKAVVNALNILRQAGYRHYRLLTTAFFSYPVEQPSDDPAAMPELADAGQVKHLNGWVAGGDFGRTQLQGHAVYGSFVSSDADKGSIELTLRKGQTIFYRSGPEAGKQRIFITTPAETFELPLRRSPEFTAIHFNGPQLPETFGVTIQDNGADWGEWSAIALRNR